MQNVSQKELIISIILFLIVFLGILIFLLYPSNESSDPIDVRQLKDMLPKVGFKLQDKVIDICEYQYTRIYGERVICIIDRFDELDCISYPLTCYFTYNPKEIVFYGNIIMTNTTIQNKVVGRCSNGKCIYMASNNERYMI